MAIGDLKHTDQIRVQERMDRFQEINEFQHIATNYSTVNAS